MISRSGASLGGSRRLAVAIVTAILATAGQADAQALWGAARLGDSPATVLAAFPNAQPPDPVLAKPGGEVELLALDQVFADESYMASFNFRDGALAWVTLTAEAPGPFSPDEFDRSKRIAPALARLYGGEPVCQYRSLGYFAAYSCEWVTGGLRISYLYIGGDKTIEIGSVARPSHRPF